MVRLHVKRGGESEFLLEAPSSARLADLAPLVARIHNGRLKVQRLCSEMEELAEHGISLPYNMQGLTEEQIEELKLKDEWAEKCVPSGGSVFRKDELGRRNGFAPNEKMQQVIKKTIEEAKALISKKQVQAGVCVGVETVTDALEQLRGAVLIVYPMGLPPHDPIRMEFEDKEDLSGTHAGTEVIKESEAQLWWAGKQLEETKLLSDYVGKNEKTTIIVKIQKGHWEVVWHLNSPGSVGSQEFCLFNYLKDLLKEQGQYRRSSVPKRPQTCLFSRASKSPFVLESIHHLRKGQGAPGREPVISHEEQKEMMLYYYRKQEELKKLEEEDDDSFLNAEWADNHALKRQFHGVKDIKWGPR